MLGTFLEWTFFKEKIETSSFFFLMLCFMTRERWWWGGDTLLGRKRSFIYIFCSMCVYIKLPPGIIFFHLHARPATKKCRKSRAQGYFFFFAAGALLLSNEGNKEAAGDKCGKKIYKIVPGKSILFFGADDCRMAEKNK